MRIVRTQTRLFASGFRPTFLMAGLAALTLIPAWAAVWVFGATLGTNWRPTLWHAHELVFGFVGAAIAGFLLTAVPSWTGHRGFGGLPLIILVTVWFSGRLIVASGASWPAGVVLAVDVGFLVLLAGLLAPPLLRARNRNTPLLFVLALLAMCNIAFYWALMRRDVSAASHSLLMAIDIALLMVTVIGGRILPAFTSSGLHASGSKVTVRAWPLTAAAAIGVMVAVALVDLLWPNSRGAGVLAGIAAIIQAIRLAQWRTTATLKQPILWVLHVAYAWLPLGLALKSAALLAGIAGSAFWLHALTIGVLATMVFGVMTRAALGHTGRPVIAQPLTVAAYVLLSISGVTRVFGLSTGLNYPLVILLSASLWTSSFAFFLWVYVPILCSPRVDGKTG